jgi:hypothetical protein
VRICRVGVPGPPTPVKGHPGCWTDRRLLEFVSQFIRVVFFLLIRWSLRAPNPAGILKCVDMVRRTFLG